MDLRFPALTRRQLFGGAAAVVVLVLLLIRHLGGGGATRKAQLDTVNLAVPVADGEQVIVPRSGAAGAAAGVGTSAPAAGSSPSAPLDLNSATLEQLEALPGIGPVTAQKILDYRQQHGAFHSIAELQGLPGIGPAHMAQLKALVIP